MPSVDLVRARRRRALWWCVAVWGAVVTIQAVVLFAQAHPEDLADFAVVNVMVMGLWLLIGLALFVIACVYRQPVVALAVVLVAASFL